MGNKQKTMKARTFWLIEVATAICVLLLFGLAWLTDGSPGQVLPLIEGAVVSIVIAMLFIAIIILRRYRLE